MANNADMVDVADTQAALGGTDPSLLTEPNDEFFGAALRLDDFPTVTGGVPPLHPGVDSHANAGVAADAGLPADCGGLFGGLFSAPTNLAGPPPAVSVPTYRSSSGLDEAERMSDCTPSSAHEHSQSLQDDAGIPPLPFNPSSTAQGDSTELSDPLAAALVAGIAEGGPQEGCNDVTSLLQQIEAQKEKRRHSARRSRLKKKMYVQHLELERDQLRRELSQLRSQINYLKSSATAAAAHQAAATTPQPCGLSGVPEDHPFRNAMAGAPPFPTHAASHLAAHPSGGLPDSRRSSRMSNDPRMSLTESGAAAMRLPCGAPLAGSSPRVSADSMAAGSTRVSSAGPGGSTARGGELPTLSAIFAHSEAADAARSAPPGGADR